MYELSRSTTDSLKRAKRTRDEDKIEKAKSKTLAKECKRWARSPFGKYGLLTEAECKKKGQELVKKAWEKLKKVAPKKMKDVMKDYEKQHDGPPKFDTKGEVDKDAGGSTTTGWRNYQNGFVQTSSGRILVGSKYVCRRMRGKRYTVLTSIMKTLTHELMGHWNKLGQRVGADSGLSQKDRRGVRRDKAERRADKTTDKLWNKIKRTTAFKKCVEECEDDFDRRKEQAKKEIAKAIDKALKAN